MTGKRDDRDAPLIPPGGELTADRLRPLLARRLEQRLATPLIVAEANPAPERARLTIIPNAAPRTAAFCSGCPHNRSTVPGAGSPVGGGVGCHAMVMWLDRGAVSYTQMGGEGAQWIGRAPFTDVPHFVQNVGDGTFFHSGSLAVRAAVSAGVTMTFKVLYNGVVAMTGGQDPAGQLDVPHLCQAMAAEGVARIIVVSDDPSRYRRAALPAGTQVWGRDRLAEAERALAKVPGVTLLVYDQACAAELRRLRKRGQGPRAHPARGHQRGGLRGLRRLRRQVQLPVRAAGGHRAGPQDADRPGVVQYRLQLPGRRLPVVRDRGGSAAGGRPRAAGPGAAGRHSRAAAARPPSRTPAGTGSWPPASAAPGW